MSQAFQYKVNNHTQSLRTPRFCLRLGSLARWASRWIKCSRPERQTSPASWLAERRPFAPDTFDMKPDAPRIRGEFKPIPTNVPGIHISEHLPFTARQADKYNHPCAP